MVARRFGAAMFPDLALERGGFRIRLAHHPRECPRQHPGLAAGIDRDRHRIVAADAFDRRRQLTDRPDQRFRKNQRQRGREQHRDQTDLYGAVADRRRRRHEHSVRKGFDHADPFIAGEKRGRECFSAELSGFILHDARDTVGCSKRGRQVGEVFLPVGRRAEVRAELARGVGMNQIVAAFIDDVDLSALPHRRPHPVEGRSHVDVDDGDAERLAVGCHQGGGDAQGRHVRYFDDTILLIEIKCGNVGLIGRQADRLLEVAAVALALQLRIGNQPDGMVRARTIDTNDFASAILDADDPELRVSRLGFEFGQQALRELVVPALFGEAIDGIGAAGEMRPDQPVQCGRRPKACNVAARAAHLGLQIDGEEP